MDWKRQLNTKVDALKNVTNKNNEGDNMNKGIDLSKTTYGGYGIDMANREVSIGGDIVLNAVPRDVMQINTSGKRLKLEIIWEDFFGEYFRTYDNIEDTYTKLCNLGLVEDDKRGLGAVVNAIKYSIETNRFWLGDD